MAVCIFGKDSIIAKFRISCLVDIWQSICFFNIVTWIKMDIIATLQNSRNGHYIHIYESKIRYYSHSYAYYKYGHNNHFYTHTLPPVQPHISSLSSYGKNLICFCKQKMATSLPLTFICLMCFACFWCGSWLVVHTWIYWLQYFQLWRGNMKT